MPRVTVEHHGYFIHCSAQQVACVLRQLEDTHVGDQPPHAVSSAHNILVQAADAAKQVHTGLLARYPSIKGRAATNFGTLLRVGEVREMVDSAAVRDLPLIKVLGYIADAADAQRHLTPTLIMEAIALVRQLLDQSQPPPPAGFVGSYGCGTETGSSTVALSEGGDSHTSNNYGLDRLLCDGDKQYDLLSELCEVGVQTGRSHDEGVIVHLQQHIEFLEVKCTELETSCNELMDAAIQTAAPEPTVPPDEMERVKNVQKDILGELLCVFKPEIEVCSHFVKKVGPRPLSESRRIKQGANVISIIELAHAFFGPTYG